MDEGKPDEEIDAAIIQLIDIKGVELEHMRAVVSDLAISYAEKHGIELKLEPDFK